jgi:hypothetical protein
MLVLDFAQKPHGNLEGNSQGVIAREAIAATLQLCWIGSATQHRANETVEAGKIKEKRIVNFASEEKVFKFE